MGDKHFLTQDGRWVTASDDELYHWKYTKREKVNGKWVYTYDNDKLGVKNFIDTKITGNAYWQDAIEAGNKMANAKSEEEFDKAKEESKEALDDYLNKSLKGNIQTLRLKGNKALTSLSKKIENSSKESATKITNAAIAGKQYIDNFLAKKKKK